MNWQEVRRHLRRGAELVFTDDIPGGWCFAVRHRGPREWRRSKLVKVRGLPLWAGMPSLSDTRSVRAALEMAIATDEHARI